MTVTREAWVAALRSGKYKQNRLSLFRDGAYCCLGVACSLAGVGDGKLRLSTSITLGEFDPTLPVTLGITEDDMIVLARINDMKESNFSTIADTIEALPFRCVETTARGVSVLKQD